MGNGWPVADCGKTANHRTNNRTTNEAPAAPAADGVDGRRHRANFSHPPASSITVSTHIVA